MPNTNCLAGMQCPKCRSEGPFKIEVTSVIKMSDEGAEGDADHTDWGDDSYCECCQCAFAGKVGDFTVSPATVEIIA
jgi:hypothetical protein